MVNAGNGEGMVFANNIVRTNSIVRTLLSVCGQVAVDQVVADQTLAPVTPVRSKTV